MKRYSIINHFIKKYNYKSYLEIGIDNPSNCFNKINLEDKTGVDPNKNTTFKLTSNDFFKQNRKDFDIIFIDGLHIQRQFVNDVYNSLKVLSPGGTIVCHDCKPYNKRVAAPERVPGQSWYGTVYLGWLELRYYHTDLEMAVVDLDCGVGIIQRAKQCIQKFPKYDRLITTFDDYIKNYSKALNIQSFEAIDKVF